MMLKGSPYSLVVQFAELAERATRTPASVHVSEEAWCVPKLWPSSCAITRRLIPSVPFSHELRPGTSARPDHAQLDAVGKAYTTLSYALRLTPAAVAAPAAEAAQLAVSHAVLVSGIVYQPSTLPVSVS